MDYDTEDNKPTGEDIPEVVKKGVYGGKKKARRESSEESEVRDDINGTVYIREEKLKAEGIDAGDNVRVYVEANGKSTETTRNIHGNGSNLTIPISNRRELDLEPGDEMEIWVMEAEEKGEEKKEEKIQQSDLRQQVASDDGVSGDGEHVYIVIPDEFIAHKAESEDADEAICGAELNLSMGERRVGEEKPEFVDVCDECSIPDPSNMSNSQIVSWLADEIEAFEIEGQTDAYMTKSQLTAIMDVIIEDRYKDGSTAEGEGE